MADTVDPHIETKMVSRVLVVGPRGRELNEQKKQYREAAGEGEEAVVVALDWNSVQGQAVSRAFVAGLRRRELNEHKKQQRGAAGEGEEAVGVALDWTSVQAQAQAQAQARQLNLRSSRLLGLLLRKAEEAHRDLTVAEQLKVLFLTVIPGYQCCKRDYLNRGACFRCGEGACRASSISCN